MLHTLPLELRMNDVARADSATPIGYMKRLYFGGRQRVPDANLGLNWRI
jgi:hypothetical protein